MRKIFLAFIGLMTVAPLALGQAKDFPNRAIKVIVPFTAGSGSDTSARFFGEKMSAILGQTVVVENRPGASGVMRCRRSSRRPPTATQSFSRASP